MPFKKGHKINVGKFLSEETKKKISEANKGKNNPMWGKHHSEKTIQKNREAHLGKYHSEETKKKISKFQKGRKKPPFSEEHKRRIGKGHSGEKCYFWKGGIFLKLYSIDWTETLRRSIRERDRYICQLCGGLQGDRVHSVHHIDYDKLNCNPNNLITLCNSCNVKVNSNRKRWTNYFKNLIL